MKLNKYTVAWLVLGLAGLVSSYATGFLQAHTDVAFWLLLPYKFLGAVLGPLASKELPKG